MLILCQIYFQYTASLMNFNGCSQTGCGFGLTMLQVKATQKSFHSSLLLGLYKNWRTALEKHVGLPACVAHLAASQAQDIFQIIRRE